MDELAGIPRTAPRPRDRLAENRAPGARAGGGVDKITRGLDEAGALDREQSRFRVHVRPCGAYARRNTFGHARRAAPATGGKKLNDTLMPESPSSFLRFRKAFSHETKERPPSWTIRAATHSKMAKSAKRIRKRSRLPGENRAAAF